MPEWSDASQCGVLHELIYPNRSPHLIEIPRDFLRKKIADGTFPEYRPGSSMSAIDVAASILAKSGEAADKKLVREAGAVFPKSRLIWLCLARWNETTTDERARAVATYSDESIGLPIRLAAATAIATVDASAAQFVTEQLQEILTQYASLEPIDLATLMKDAYVNDDRAAAAAYIRHGDKVALLSTLRFLETDVAKQLTFEYLKSPNMYIRSILQLTAAIRWPSKLIETLDPSEEVDDYVKLMAAIALYHPEMHDSVRKKVSESEFDACLERLRKGGIGIVFLLSGNIVNGWH